MAALDNTLGAELIGIMIAAVLYGCTCVQTWYYFSQYRSDPWYLKLLVTSVLIFDTCHQVLITHLIYTYLVTYFGVWSELENVVWSLTVEVIFNALITLLVQCFLAMRVYKLSNKNWLATGVVMMFVLGEFFSSIIFVIEVFTESLNTFASFSRLNALSMTVNGLSAAGDLIIAGLLCYLLQVSRTGFRKSDSLISKLIVFSINTGLLTSLCAFASLISISVWPSAKIYIAFYYCIGRLYANSLLATLNARKRLRSGSQGGDISLSHTQSVPQKLSHSMTGPSSRVDFLKDDGHHGLMSRQHVSNNISIKVDTTQEYIRDEQFSSSNGDLKDPEVV